MLLVPRLQTLMVGADGDGMEGYVPSSFPEREKFIVFSALCFCFSCCLLLL